LVLYGPNIRGKGAFLFEKEHLFSVKRPGLDEKGSVNEKGP